LELLTRDYEARDWEPMSLVAAGDSNQTTGTRKGNSKGGTLATFEVG